LHCIPIRLQRRGVETKLVIQGPNASYSPDLKLCRLIAQARLLFDQLAAGEEANIRALSKKVGVHENEITRVLPLAFLAPQIIEDILDGRQPTNLTAQRLRLIGKLPANWEEQVALVR